MLTPTIRPSSRRSSKCFICLRGNRAMRGAVAVLDVGKTNVKLALFAPDGAGLWESSTPNRPLSGPPYLHADVETIWAFFLASLAEAAKAHAIETIIPTA